MATPQWHPPATGPRGFGLLDVLLALVVLLAGSLAMMRLAVATAQAVSAGRRWTAMATAAENEMVRLEREFRRARPVCVPPASGSRFTPDGVALAWSVRGDSVTAAVNLEARAMVARRVLSDSVSTTLSCR